MGGAGFSIGSSRLNGSTKAGRILWCNLERYVGYGITDYWDEIVKAMHGTPVVTDVAEFSQRMTAFETRVRQDIDEIYTRDRRAHARTARLMETGGQDVSRGLGMIYGCWELKARDRRRFREAAGTAKGPASQMHQEELGSSA
ncbi:hypothetical protein Tco_0132525 [Tanacetum coccineum]